MSVVLNKIDYDFFKEHFEELTDEQLEKLEKNILFLYENTVSHYQRVIKRGFNEDYTNIVHVEWILFISRMLPIIEKIKNIKIGKEKLELLLSFIIFIIIKLLPIDDLQKEVLIIILKEFIPYIAEALIYTSKKIHKLSLKMGCC